MRIIAQKLVALDVVVNVSDFLVMQIVKKYRFVLFKLKIVSRLVKRRIFYKHLAHDEVSRLLANLESEPFDYKGAKFSEIDFHNFSKIIVVGPQRSGTTICSKILAQMLDYTYHDEIDFFVNDVWLFQRILRSEKIVVQAPSLTHKIDQLIDKDTLVVLMIRDPISIVRSVLKKNGFLTNRVFLKNQRHLLQKQYRYHKNARSIILSADPNETYLLSIYRLWKSCQAPNIPNSVEIEYDTLSDQPLWIEQELRRDFKAKQTDFGGISIPKT